MRFQLLLVLMAIDKTRLVDVVQAAGKSLTHQVSLLRVLLIQARRRQVNAPSRREK